MINALQKYQGTVILGNARPIEEVATHFEHGHIELEYVAHAQEKRSISRASLVFSSAAVTHLARLCRRQDCSGYFGIHANHCSHIGDGLSLQSDVVDAGEEHPIVALDARSGSKSDDIGLPVIFVAVSTGRVRRPLACFSRCHHVDARNGSPSSTFGNG